MVNLLLRKLICGVGINDADYVAEKKMSVSDVDGITRRVIVWGCPFYRVWKGMIERGCSEKFKVKYPTYKDVTVCEEWYRFSVFKAWMEGQDWEGKELDKDILVLGNKVYSPETCVFVSKQVNLFIIEGSSRNSTSKIGTHLYIRTGKYAASCQDPFLRSKEHLGYFNTEQEAHEAWLVKKLQHAQMLSSLQDDTRVGEALLKRYKNYKPSD